MNTCDNCGKELPYQKYVTRKFCSRRCSNKAHEQVPRKKMSLQGVCTDCGQPIHKANKRCRTCFDKRKIVSRIKRLKRTSRKVKEWRRAVKKKAIEYKGGECIRCGYSKCVWALQFHHRDPDEKDFAISSPNPKSWDKTKLELDKCDLVCSNCHSEIHEEQFSGVM